MNLLRRFPSLRRHHPSRSQSFNTALKKGASIKLNGCMIDTRSYHSFPDPDEKPVITTSKASFKKSVNKDDISLPKFNMGSMFPGVPVSKGLARNTEAAIEESKLSNGITIASYEKPGMMSSFAFVMAAGSSYEVQNDGPNSTLGSTHMIELTAFKSTSRRSHEDIVNELEELGAMVQCLTTRESVMFCLDVLRENIEPALDIFADAIIDPLLTEDEVDEGRLLIGFTSSELPSDMISGDAVVRAGYPGSPLGNYHFCPEEKAGSISKEAVKAFRSKYLFGENCWIAAAGVDHQTFLELSERYFSNIPKANIGPGLDVLRKFKNRPPSTYTGGMVKCERKLKEEEERKEPYVKVSLAFEIGGWNDENLITLCLLHQLLGGGSSFSAGGPGKGMYTRLYKEVLNQNHWVEAAQSFMSIHDESGLFGIDGACAPEYVTNMLEVIITQFANLCLHLPEEVELDRAKNMLKSNLLTQLESRLILCEDIARQYSTYGRRESAQSLCAKIDAVTANDIMTAAKKMLCTQPSVGAAGLNLTNIPEYENIETFIRSVRKAIKLVPNE